MGTVTLTLEEYEALIGKSIGSKLPSSTRGTKKQFTQREKAIKRKGKTAPGMGAALREANRRARKKDGSFRKGYTQNELKMAHKIRRSRK